MRSRYTPPRPWEPLSDAEWAALAPFVLHAGPGRPLADPRARLDAIFRAVTADGPWAALPEAHGRADTVHRQFRRWTHAGLWTRLLTAAASRRAPAALRRLVHWICRAYRRALRILGLPGIVLARRLDMPSALPGPPWMLPDPDLSETVHAVVAEAMKSAPERRPPPDLLRIAIRLLRTAAGRRRIPRCLAPP